MMQDFSVFPGFFNLQLTVVYLENFLLTTSDVIIDILQHNVISTFSFPLHQNLLIICICINGNLCWEIYHTLLLFLFLTFLLLEILRNRKKLTDCIEHENRVTAEHKQQGKVRTTTIDLRF